MRQAEIALGANAQAAGKLTVPICRCESGGGRHNTGQHPSVNTSGFWLEGNNFVTAAHFLDLLPNTNKLAQGHTIGFLKALNDNSALSNGKLGALVSSQYYTPDHLH
jgi:hypothetical protein